MPMVETIKPADWGYLRLYGCGPKSVSVGSGCKIDWRSALSVTALSVTT